MAKKQTRRSISVSRATYERLKSFCETQGISMSQIVENEVNEMLSHANVPGVESLPPRAPIAPTPPRATMAPPPRPIAPRQDHPLAGRLAQVPSAVPPRTVTPMTSAAARFAVEPPPPIIKPREPVDAKPPTPPTADQIFTF